MKLKQVNIPWVGAITESLFNSLPLLSVINFLSIVTVLYTSIRPYLLVWAPWFTLWWFVGIAAGATLIVMCLIYFFVLPSLWTFRNKQMNSFESDVMKELKELRKEVQELKEGKK